ncbi:MAG: DUF4239 domain-containing protein [bacterium]
MGFVTRTGLMSVALLAAMLVALELGRRYGRRWRATRGGREPAAFSTVQGAILGLLGLLVAFSFSGAAQRFDARRELVTEEANAIGTAYLRIDLLPPAAQPALRDAFRGYVDARLEIYRHIATPTVAREARRRAEGLQGVIWQQALAALHDAQSPAVWTLVVPALNEMFDIATTRMRAMVLHPPRIVFGLLAGLSLLGAALAGFELAARDEAPHLVLFAFAFTLAVTFYVIVDLEYPRLGLIRADGADQVLLDLRASMG